MSTPSSIHRDGQTVLYSPTSSPILPSSSQSRVAFSLASSPADFVSFPSNNKAGEDRPPSSYRSSAAYYPQVPPLLHHQAIVSQSASSGMIHPHHHSPNLSPESSARLYPFYPPPSNVINLTTPPDCTRLLSSTPTKMGQLPRQMNSNSLSSGAATSGGGELHASATAGMRPRAATVTAGGEIGEISGLLRTAGGIPVSSTTPSTSGTTGSNSAPGVTPLKKSSRRNPWGPETYSDLITVAIHSYPEQQATLQQIYDFIIANYEYFRERSDPTSSAGWKNSIRHNLSLHDRFTKCPKSTDNTKSSYWRINTEVASKPYVRRRACSIDNANLKRSGGHHQHSSAGRPGSGHNRQSAVVSNGLSGGSHGGNKRDTKPPGGEGLSRCLPPGSNRSPPLPMLCELSQTSTMRTPHPLNLQQLASESPSSAVAAAAAAAAAASSYLGYSSGVASRSGGPVAASGGLTDDRVTLLGHNMMILGGGGGGQSASAADGTVCWPSLPSPKSMVMDGCGGVVGQYHYLQQQPQFSQQQHHQYHQQQHELVSTTPFGSFRFPSGFGSSSTDQSFRSRTSGLIEQLLRVDDSPSALAVHSSSEQAAAAAAAAAAYLLPDTTTNNRLGSSAQQPPYFPNALLVNTASVGGGAPDRRQPQPPHHLQHEIHQAVHQQYEHSRQQNLPMHIDTSQQQQLVVRGNGASAVGEPASSPSPIALLKQQHHHQQHRMARSPNASVIHHHPSQHTPHHIHQHLRPVSLHSGAGEVVGMVGQSSPLTGYPASSSSALPSWPSVVGTNGCSATVYQTAVAGGDHLANNNSGGEGQRQFGEVGQPWSSPSSSFMPNCANSEDSNDPFAAIGLLPRDSTTAVSSGNKISPNGSSGSNSCSLAQSSLSPSTMMFYSRSSLSARTPSASEYSSSYQTNETGKLLRDPVPHYVLKAENNSGDGDAGNNNCGDLSPLSGGVVYQQEQQQQKHMFQPGGDRSCFTSYPSRVSAENDGPAFSGDEHQRRHQALAAVVRSTAEVGFFDGDKVVKREEGVSTQTTRDARSLEMNTEAVVEADDGVEDCESLELQLSLELADRIVGSSGIGR